MAIFMLPYLFSNIIRVKQKHIDLGKEKLFQRDCHHHHCYYYY